MLTSFEPWNMYPVDIIEKGTPSLLDEKGKLLLRPKLSTT